MHVTSIVDWRNWLVGMRVGHSEIYGNFPIFSFGPFSIAFIRKQKGDI